MKVAIIGAGYSGMSAANELIKRDYEVTIYEKSDYSGGMCDTIELCGTNIEKYYRHIFKSDKYVIELIKELSLEDKLIWPSTKMGYLSGNKMYEFGTPISLLKFKPLNFIDKMRFGFNILHIKMINDYKKIEKFTAEDWLKRRIGEKAYSTIWEPLLLSKFGEEKSNVSMAWLWGKIKLRSTSSTKEGEQLGYIKGSYQVLTDHFFNHLKSKGVNFKLNSTVKTITKEKGKYLVESDNGEEKGFDYVICTTDYNCTQKILGDLISDEERTKMESVDYTSARTMLIIAKKSFSKFYWLNIGDNDVPFGGIIEHTNMIDKSNYDNNTIIYISNYMTEGNKLYHSTKEQMFNEYMKYLKRINPDFSESDVVDYYVFDEKYAQPIIKCNYSEILLDTKLKEENIFVCTMPQIYPEDRGMNYAIKLGKRVADEIIKG